MKIGLHAVAALKNYGLMAAGFGLVGIVVGAFTAGPAIAQAVRAALVSNVDDPGRIPYQVQKVCIFTGASQTCLVNAPAVPAGKRLVILHISGSVRENLPGGTDLLMTLEGRHGTIIMPTAFQGSENNHNHFIFDQSELAFYDQLEAPLLRLEMGANPDFESSFTATLSGYMLDCTTGPCAGIAP